MNELSRLRWQCRRGTRELDILLENYLAQHYQVTDKEEQQAFVELLALEDSQLLAFLLGGKIVEQKRLRQVIDKIRNHFMCQ